MTQSRGYLFRVINFLFTILLWYIANAIFDTADAALAALNIETAL